MSEYNNQAFCSSLNAHITVQEHMLSDLSPIHTADTDLNVELSRVGVVGVNRIRNSRRVPTDSVHDYLELTKQTPQRFDYVNFD